MIIGYARVSTQEQNLDLQLEALKKYGCERIYQESISTRKKSRPEMQKCLDSLRAGDRLVVWRFDRLERGLKELVNLADDFKNRGIDFVSITQNIDTSTPNGKLQFNIFAVLAENERDLIRERTLAGLEIARNNGRLGGRRFAVSEQDQAMIKTLMNDPSQSPTEIAKKYGISRATAYKIANGTYLQGRNAKQTASKNTAPVLPPVEPVEPPKPIKATKTPKTKKTAKNAPVVETKCDKTPDMFSHDWRVQGLNDEQITAIRNRSFEFDNLNPHITYPNKIKAILDKMEIWDSELRNPETVTKYKGIDEILAK